jgi:hypothetical protein
MLTLEQNRVTVAVDIVRERFATLTQEQLERTDATLVNTYQDHFDAQSVQSRAHVGGLMPTSECLSVYAALGASYNGHNGGWADGVDTATKYAVTLWLEKATRKLLEGRA